MSHVDVALSESHQERCLVISKQSTFVLNSTVSKVHKQKKVNDKKKEAIRGSNDGQRYLYYSKDNDARRREEGNSEIDGYEQRGGRRYMKPIG